MNIHLAWLLTAFVVGVGAQIWKGRPVLLWAAVGVLGYLFSHLALDAIALPAASALAVALTVGAAATIVAILPRAGGASPKANARAFLRRLRHTPVEIVFTLAMVLAMLAFAAAFGLPVRLPSPDGAEFFGLHYLLPLIGVLVWGCCAAFGLRAALPRTMLAALPCYAVVLIVHFNLKLWAPLINPMNFDGLYWAMDEAARPLIDFCFDLRTALSGVLPYDSNIYLISFIALFYASFCYHAVWTPVAFRSLFLSALFLQGLGGLAYLALPAVGPFIFEPGVNPFVTELQQHMMRVRDDLLTGGADWIAQHGSANLVAGLAAMPSLHGGSSFLFLWYAFRHGRVLLPLYMPLFVFVLFAAIATRWHYWIDLPVGIAIAAFCIYLGERLTRVPADGSAMRGAVPDAVPARS